MSAKGVTPPKRVGVVFHPGKPASRTIHRILHWLAERAEITILGDHPLSQRMLESLGARTAQITAREPGGVPEFVVSFGGDGTLLYTVNSLGYHPRAWFLGLNYGNLGFLTEGEVSEGLQLLRSIWKSDCWIDRRKLLEIELVRDEEVIWSGQALNEAVIRQGRMMRPLRARFFLDKIAMTVISADGFIVATPTGSTAYALSAGGPIVHPFLECFEITAIAPHTMDSRSIVVPDKGTITLVVESAYHQARLYVDGMEVQDLVTDDSIRVRASRKRLHFVRVHQHHYYKTLREKLGWNR